MIPKIIHLCWLGNQVNDSVKKTLYSWINNLWKADYKIMIWDSSTIDKFMDSPFFKHMYENKKWAFCSDYIRCKVLYEYGGIYLDTDVDVIDSFDRILQLNTFFGLECVEYIPNNDKEIEKNNKYKINNRSVTSAIMGSYSHNNLFNLACKNLDNCDINKYGIDYIITDIIVNVIKNNYSYKIVNSIKEAEDLEEQKILPIFNASAFDRWYDAINEQDYGFCDHHFFNSWLSDSNKYKLGKLKLDKIFVIHMASAKERLINIEHNQKLFDNNITIYYTCRKPHVNKIIKQLPNNFLLWPYHENIDYNDIKINTALLDITINIYNIVKTSYELGYENIMIMEDDVSINVTKKELIDIYNNIPDDYDILQARPYVEKDDNLPLWYDNKYSKDTWGTQLFVLNRRGMKYFIDFYDNNMKAGDSVLMFFNENNNDNYKYYILNKNIIDFNGETLINNTTIIPKIIHYIWLSGEEYPESIKLIIDGWKKILPGYKLRLWTSEDYNNIPNKPQYIIDAYNQKKWAFVSDYIRIYALYTEGGWYFDSDLQIIKNELDNLSKHSIVSAIEYSGNNVQIQAAFIGGVSEHSFFKDILNYYNTINFDYKHDNTIIAPVIYAKIAEKYGFEYINKEQLLNNDILLVDSSKVAAHMVHIKDSSVPFAIHHCYHSWVDNEWGINNNYISFLNNLDKDRWIIQSFWTKPLLKQNNLDISIHVNMCKLSCLFAQRSGFKVRMYTDSYGYDILKDVGFDEINTLLDEIPENISTNLFAAGKFWALRNAGLGVIHIDYDVFIKKPMCILDFYEDKSIDVILQCKEQYTNNIINYNKLAETANKVCNTKYFNIFSKKISNVGVIGFNNKELFDLYLKNYFENLDYIDHEKLDKYKYNKIDFILEQIAIADMSKGYNVKYVLDNIELANIYGYQHLQGTSKFEKSNIDIIKILIDKFKIYNEQKKASLN